MSEGTRANWSTEEPPHDRIISYGKYKNNGFNCIFKIKIGWLIIRISRDYEKTAAPGTQLAALVDGSSLGSKFTGGNQGSVYRMRLILSTGLPPFEYGTELQEQNGLGEIIIHPGG
jgi:hypothetical protein